MKWNFRNFVFFLVMLFIVAAISIGVDTFIKALGINPYSPDHPILSIGGGVAIVAYVAASVIFRRVEDKKNRK